MGCGAEITRKGDASASEGDCEKARAHGDEESEMGTG